MTDWPQDLITTLQEENQALKQRFETLTQELQQTRWQLEQNLIEKNHIDAMLTRVLSHLGSGAIMIDLQGNLSFINQAAADLLGCHPETLIGQPFQLLLEPCAEKIRLSLQTGQEIPAFETSLKDNRGRSVPVRLNLTLLPGPFGEAWGLVVTLEDLSRLQELSEQASRVSTLTALGEMSATIAHEIRNPLGGIGGFAGLLERDMHIDDPNRRLVKKIIEGVAGLNRMVTSLLNYTRPFQLNLRPINIVEVVEDCLGFFEIDAGTRLDDIELERQFPHTPLMCRADPEHLQQIVLNLLHNAVQAMPDGGQLTLSLIEQDTRNDSRTHLSRPCVAFTVSDTGMGMTDDVKSKLFMPFFTTKENGNGLGLATAKKVIEAHGGDILAESGLNSGATFIIDIPK